MHTRSPSCRAEILSVVCMMDLGKPYGQMMFCLLKQATCAFVRLQMKHPFGEVINSYQNESVSVRGFRLNQGDCVDTSHGERPRTSHIVHWRSRPIDLVCIYLTEMAFSNVFETVVLHS